MEARGYVILGRLDIEGASDSVPHEHLFGALERLGIAFLPARFRKTRLLDRRFRVRLKALSWQPRGEQGGVSRGLPQGRYTFTLLLTASADIRG